jgi:putative membrane-bound dehydrogenase-like protein
MVLPMTRLLCLSSLFVLVPYLAAQPVDGVLPVGADGRPLNLDFETGTLKDWKAEGEAFKGQPIKGDTVARRRGDMKSQHQGQYWIGTFEVRGDAPQGTLTSVPFKVTHPYASFLVGGGPRGTTCVELVRKDTGEVFSRTSGVEEENLRRVVIDLQAHLGKEIFIRLVDRDSVGWGHINFDDFRFHTTRPTVADRPGHLPLDVYKYAGLPPEKAAAVMTVPEGFTVKLFAGEPDVHQPIAFCLDDRGRVWVAEAYSYPIRRPDKEAKDRIVIFEDTDGDGKFDKRTVFMEGLNLVSGLEVGFGGVWIGAAPYLMFVPMKDGEDQPSGPPRILLDGWHYEDTHETLNTFSWGPDGWLYGCHGVFTYSRVGKPGTPDAERVPINAGIWRYHPTRHVFEVFAEGTSNPWGLDFNDFGQAFCEACVIPHCFHIIQGARYLRQAGNHFNPYTYADINTIADHLHYLGANPHGGNERSDSAGGGHAHCGTMLYLGDTWPQGYRNRMFMGNIHGRRLNMDILKAKGSGYVASHGKDFLLANDAWARFINMRYGPDGNVYLIDWYDKQACHLPNPGIWDRSNGRIYKISYRGTKPVQADLRKLSDSELVEMQLHSNDWYVRHARRLLQERGGNPQVHEALEKIAFEHANPTRRLRGLWALHVTGGLTPERIARGLSDTEAHVRAWTIQLALDSGKATSELLHKLSELAASDPSPVVRLYLASGAQRLPLEQRGAILEGLLAHAEDARDHNLPLMYWYAAEPLGGADPGKALDLALASRVPPMLLFMARRIASGASPDSLARLTAALMKSDNAETQKDILRGMQEGLQGRPQVASPAGWDEAASRLLGSADAEVRNRTAALAVTFGDRRALDRMRGVLASRDGDPAARLQALVVLVAVRDKGLPPLLQRLLDEPALRGPALRGLAVFDDPRTPGAVLGIYESLPTAEKRDALNTLTSRVAYGRALMDAVEAKKVPAADVSAELVRQLRNLHNSALDRRIAEVWGVVRNTPADRLRAMEHYRQMVKTPADQPPDLALGRAIYTKTCGQCHTLFGVGGKTGPDITGSNRANLDYLLENILDPSAVIPKEYAATVLELKNGRVITGIVKAETPAALTVATANETMTIPQSEVDSRKPSATSMMPEDQLKPLSNAEVLALFAYLQSPKQAPILATKENARDFFNGKDLTGWIGDTKLWRVEDGEIIGKTTEGLKKNTFLVSEMAAADFRLTLKVKLVPNKENSGVQFRSELLEDGEMRGPQADIGEGWWGKLYEESARGILSDRSGEKFVKKNDWNTYEILAVGSKVKTWINGELCVDIDDAKLARRGVFGLQMHAGGPMEVRFKDLRLEVNPTGADKKER